MQANRPGQPGSVVALPPGIPFTLQLTVVFVASLTDAVNACGSPSGTDAIAGATDTPTLGGGGCNGAEPTRPLQPRNDATRSNAGRQWLGVRGGKQRPRSFVLASIAAPSARRVPVRCSETRLCRQDRLATLKEENNVSKAHTVSVLLKFKNRERAAEPKNWFEDSVSSDDGSVPSWEKHAGTAIQFGANCIRRFERTAQSATLRAVDTGAHGLNNRTMPRPEAAHRVKSYSAATGYVYQYYFYEVEKKKLAAAEGTEYVYMASVDRKHVFPVRIFVAREALENWSARTGRQFTGTEEYAVAKMRLFQAFDELEGFSEKTPELIVNETNLETLLGQLDF